MPSSKFRTQKATDTHWAKKKNAEWWGKNISQVFGGQVNELNMLTLAKSGGSPSVNWTPLSMWWFQGDHYKRWTFSLVVWCAVGWNKTRPLVYFSMILSQAGSLLKFQRICPLMGHSTGTDWARCLLILVTVVVQLFWWEWEVWIQDDEQEDKKVWKAKGREGVWRETLP